MGSHRRRGLAATPKGAIASDHTEDRIVGLTLLIAIALFLSITLAGTWMKALKNDPPSIRGESPSLAP